MKIVDFIVLSAPRLAILSILTLILGFVIIQAHYEAKTFTKITGEQVSTWDAIWVELRVDRPIIVKD